MVIPAVAIQILTSAETPFHGEWRLYYSYLGYSAPQAERSDLISFATRGTVNQNQNNCPFLSEYTVMPRGI